MTVFIFLGSLLGAMALGLPIAFALLVCGIALMLAEGRPISGFGEGFRALATERVLSIPAPVVITIVIYAVAHFVLTRTVFGRTTYAIGGNEEAARLSGVQVTKEVRTPMVAYVGDTNPAGLDDFPPVYDAKILITELSFILPSHRKEKIHKFGHMHLDDFLERADRFKNEVIICGHFSTRYHPDQVRRYLERKLPAGLKERVKVWI